MQTQSIIKIKMVVHPKIKITLIIDTIIHRSAHMTLFHGTQKMIFLIISRLLFAIMKVNEAGTPK